jgi:hypothetical protein
VRVRRWVLAGGCGPGYSAGFREVAPELACGRAGRAAEQVGVLPENMLVSIGLVESGRVDAITGQMAPWPWTVNANGTGHYFGSEQDAAAFARQAVASGARDVDVGCFQVSLQHHPDAFGSIDAAFDPVANAVFAARFLNRLKLRVGSWDQAIADYHSSTPEPGLAYQQKVLDTWRRLGNLPPALDVLAFAASDPVVILEAPVARLVRVITMDDNSAPAMAGLPRVITP